MSRVKDRKFKRGKDKDRILHESEADIRTILENAPDMIYRMSLPDGKFDYVSPASEKIFGYPPEEFYENPLLIKEVLHPDYTDYFKEKWEELIQGKVDPVYEYRILNKSGKVRWINQRNVLVKDDNDKPVAIGGVVTDITERKLMEESLKNNERQLRETIDNMNKAIAIYEAVDEGNDFVFQDMNEFGEKITLYKIDDVLGKRITELFPGEASVGLIEKLKETWETGKPTRIPLKQYKDGRITQWVENYIFKLPSGKVVAMFEDTFKIRNAEIELKKSEEKYSTVVEKGNDAIIVIQDYKIMFSNSVFAELLDYENDKIAGKIFLDFVSENDKELLKERYEKRITNDPTIPIRYEVAFVSKSGKEIPVEVSGSYIEYEGRPADLVFLRDITERKKDEARIQYLTNILSSIRNVNQLIVKEKDPQKLIQGICDNLTATQGYNGAWIVLFDDKQNITFTKQNGFENSFEYLDLKSGILPPCAQHVLTGKSDPIVLDPSNDCVVCPLSEKYENSGSLVSKLQYNNIIYGIIGASIPTAFSNDEEVLGLFEEVVGDISFALYTLELEALREETQKALLESIIAIEEANKIKSEFLATVSHELRTPLTAIIGFSDIFCNKEFGEVTENQKDFITHIHNSGNQLLGLINNILDISKIEYGEMQLNREIFSFSDIIKDVASLISPPAYKKNIGLEILDKTNNVEIFADRLKLKKVLFNILSNAIKFTPDNGEISAFVSLENGDLYISVSDTGIGIPSSMHKTIFEPFKQVDSTNIRKYGGTGLGLSLAKRYIELHDGNIWLESEPGEGTTFFITLPLDKIRTNYHN